MASVFVCLAHQLHHNRYFYIDSPENARKNDMTVNTKYEKEISDRCVSFDFAREVIRGSYRHKPSPSFPEY